MSTALLQTTYFGPIQWYQKLYRYDQTLIEQYDSYQKQTYRNRCVIATANGLQALTVPVEHDTLNIKNEILKVKDLRISDHNNWRRIHWNALQSAYNESPFFDYYADDIRLFFEKKYEFLVDFNEAIRQTVCNLLDIHPQVSYTTDFSRQPSDIDDYREVINAKHPQPDEDFQPRRYWQVFEGKHGFQANLSILDLLFNMGNEAVFYL
ncbi:MAG: WbqC family protein [Prevotella sp.]|nr:WbqC family protein [Prevotella sp.]